MRDRCENGDEEGEETGRDNNAGGQPRSRIGSSKAANGLLSAKSPHGRDFVERKDDSEEMIPRRRSRDAKREIVAISTRTSSNDTMRSANKMIVSITTDHRRRFISSESRLDALRGKNKLRHSIIRIDAHLRKDA